jgi:hypothetical protein
MMKKVVHLKARKEWGSGEGDRWRGEEGEEK